MNKIDPVTDLQHRLENLRKAKAHLEAFDVRKAILREDPEATEADLKEEELFHRNKLWLIGAREQSIQKQLAAMHAPERKENEEQKLKRLIKEKLAALTKDIENVDSMSEHDKGRLLRRKSDLEKVLRVYEKNEIKKGDK